MTDTSATPTQSAATAHPNIDTCILIGIPAYGGIVNWRFCLTLVGITKLLTERGIQHHVEFVAGSSLVSVVRNFFANLALFHCHPVTYKRFTHVLMIDADGSFDADAVLEMLKANKPITVLPFCRKDICWPNVARAVKAGIPNEYLSEYSGMAVIIPENKQININEPTPVKVAGTGCMLIETTVFLGLMKKHPEWAYFPGPHERMFRDVSVSDGISFDFFHLGVNQKTGEYDAEDYFFVNAAREAGFQCFILPWIKTTHTGAYDFNCNVPAFIKLKKETAEAHSVPPVKEVV
jgi:hypothetical protein